MGFKFDLGEIVQDKITKFEGVVMARSDYFTGCNHYGICSQTLDSTGKPREWEWFDETRIVIVDGAEKLFAEERTLRDNLGFTPTSGPMSSPPSM